MLSRGLADYDIRLRYYVVQKKAMVKKYERRPHVDLKKKVEAVRDWDNWNYKLGSVLNLYDPSVWPGEYRKKLEKLIASDEKERNAAFTDMVAFLRKHEIKVRGINTFYARVTRDRYASMRANWRMQSAFLHGDQAIISDVIEFDSEGHKTGSILAKPPTHVNVILFTALDHVENLLASFEEIHGNASGKAAFHDRCGAVWHREHENTMAQDT